MDLALLARRPIDLQHVVDRARRIVIGAVERFLNDVDDFWEADPSGKEARDGDLIGGVEHDRCGAAGLKRLSRQAKRGKALRVGRFEVESRNAARSSRCAGVAIRSGQASA